MNEVSCRAVECFFPALEARRIPLERLVDGLPISVDHLRDPAKRVDWETNVRILERVAELLGPEGFADVGMPALDAASLRLFRLLGLLVPDTRYLYRMFCRWMGPSFFTHVAYRYHELPDGRLRIDAEFPETYSGCPQFFQVFESGFRVVPRLLGRGDASVEAEISPHRGTFVIRAPRRTSLTGWLRRLLRLPGAARAAVEEVARHQHHLNRALEEVREAHSELRTHVEQIATLDRLGRALTRQLGSEQLPDRVLEFLTQRFRWRGASLWMTAPEDESLIFFGRSGRTEGDPSHAHPVVVGDRSLGRLEVWGDADESSEDRSLLEKLLPWIAMTVLNARFATTLRGEGGGTGLRWASKSGRDLFMILDENARILYAGPRVDEVLGYEPDDLLRMDVTDLVHPDDWPRLARDFSALAQHSSSAIYSSARVQRRGGDFRRMEGVAIKVLSEAGAGVYLISCGDVGERVASH